MSNETEKPEYPKLDLQKESSGELTYLANFATDAEIDRHFKYFFFKPKEQAEIGPILLKIPKANARMLMGRFVEKHYHAAGVALCYTNDYELVKGVAWGNKTIDFDAAAGFTKGQLRLWARDICKQLAEGKDIWAMRPADEFSDTNRVVPAKLEVKPLADVIPIETAPVVDEPPPGAL
jgi:hypothetical protein